MIKLAFAAPATILLLATPVAVPLQGRTGQRSPAAGVQEFQQRIQEYVSLRQRLAAPLGPLAPTPSGAELAARQRALVAAMQTARAGARPGDLLPHAVASQIRDAILADVKRRSAAAERATFSEVPAAPRPAINMPYPADAALPTVPPLLLQQLPRLPDNLQYRFYGRHLVLLDGDLQLIVDYIENALPPH